MFKIQPKIISEFPDLVVVDTFQMNNINVNPGFGASGDYSLGTVDADGVYCEKLSGSKQMTPAQYANWGTDDTYAVNCLLANLGLVRV